MAGWDDTPATGGAANTWDSGPATGGNGDWKQSDNDNNNDAFTNGGGDDFSGGNFEGGGDGGGGGGDGCRNCGQEGHFARDCPEPRKMTGDCFNCGQPGHNKADCPNEAVEREFTGTCRVCEEVGHRAADCPTRPKEPCRGCGSLDHKAAACDVNRKIDRSKVQDMSKEDAWKAIKIAAQDRDITDAKTAIDSYVKADDSVNYLDIEKRLRAENVENVYLIAREMEIPKTLTLVNLQGKGGCQYAVECFLKPKPMRKMHAEGWPSSPEENLERLADAGVSMENFVPLCRNCGEMGHMSKGCPADKVESTDQPTITCPNCSAVGHRLRDCPEERQVRERKPMDCRRCGETGHMAKDCPNEDDRPARACHNCGSEDHMSKECDQPRKMVCRNCNEEGHKSSECEKPRDASTVTCMNCDAIGHFSRDCTEKKDWSRVTCPNCGEKGHGRNYKNCKGAGGGEADGAADGEASGGFNDAEATSGGGASWGGAPASDSAW